LGPGGEICDKERSISSKNYDEEVNQIMTKRILFISLALLLAMSPVAGGCPPPVPVPEPPVPQPIELTLVSFMPIGHVTSAGAERFVELVNERAKGELIIQYLGGPEVIPKFDQLEALKAGVVDIMHSPVASYWPDMVPASSFTHLAKYEPWVDRETGFYDFLDEAFARIGVRYLGEFGGGFSTTYYLHTNIWVERPHDLAGQIMRSVPTYDPLMKALGITPVAMPGGEIYLAMAKGVVDGFGWPIYAGFIEMGFAEVTRYIIDHPFYRGHISIQMNMESYKALPEHLRALIHEVVKEIERWAVEHYAKIHQWQRRTAKELGVVFISFTPEDAEWFYAKAYGAKWDYAMARFDHCPEIRAKLKAMLRWKP
jgi:TRAP-type C4-dicarboxylate transport system substrate-binding protein